MNNNNTNILVGGLLKHPYIAECARYQLSLVEVYHGHAIVDYCVRISVFHKR